MLDNDNNKDGKLIGRISSFQSMGAVDGPGVRNVIFMQGCPLRCIYCHNPETWNMQGGVEVTVEELLSKIRRYKVYTKNGGVTVSGGEALMQADFVAELFKQLKKEGVHTALDTSGIASKEDAIKVLEYCDLVICDIKFTTEDEYKENCKGSLKKVKEFLALTQELGIELWIRQVIVPTLNDTEEQIRRLKEIATQYSNLTKIELLPFKKLCVTKYNNMGIEFPLEDVEPCDKETLERLQLIVDEMQ